MPTACTRCGVVPADPSGLHACIPRGFHDVTYDEMNRIFGGIPLEDLMAQGLQRGMAGTVASLPQDAMARWRERAEKAEAELHRLRVQTANLEAQLNRANFELLSRMHRMTQEKTNGTLDQNMLTKILSLVHPDKHANSEVSNEVTKYILSLRKK